MTGDEKTDVERREKFFEQADRLLADGETLTDIQLLRVDPRARSTSATIATASQT